MKEIVVLSGKGGTGKTSVTAALAYLMKSVVIADCDVDAADMHLLLNPSVIKEEEFSGGKVAEIIPDKCVSCGACQRHCRFDAIDMNGPGNDFVAKTYRVDSPACEGCGVCVEVCKFDAINFEPSINGKSFISDTRIGKMVHAKLGIAEENSGKLVTDVRLKSAKLAEEDNIDYILVDGSPGIGCPVIASITGVDHVLIVTEPTKSALHDLVRVALLIKHFGISGSICINKWDLNESISDEIVEEGKKFGFPLLGKIEYNDIFTKAQIAKQTVIEFDKNSNVSKEIVNIWENLQKI